MPPKVKLMFFEIQNLIFASICRHEKARRNEKNSGRGQDFIKKCQPIWLAD